MINVKEIDDSVLVEKIVIARSLLLKQHAFFGSILFSMKQIITDDPRFTSCATNGKAIYYSKNFIKRLSVKRIMFVIAHEILHCALSHFMRKLDRKHELWNAAADFAVNALLVHHKVGLTPDGVLYDPKYVNWTSEEIYEDLLKQGKGQGKGSSLTTLDDHDILWEELTEAEQTEVVEGLKAALAEGTKLAGDSPLGKAIAGLINLGEGQVNWKELLKQSLISPIRSDQTFTRLNRKAQSLGIILPTSKVEDTIDICVAIDASGSVSNRMLETFMQEIRSMMNIYQTFVLRIWSFDTKCYSYTEFTESNIDEFRTFQVCGRGGTMFECNWEFMQKEGICPTQLIILTDGYPCGTWGDSNYCSTLFCICDAPGIVPPFGDYIHIVESN